MKLNNHGWGLKEEIVYICILLFLLLVATIFIHSFYNDLEKSKKEYEKNNKINNTLIDEDNEEEKKETKEQKQIDYSYYYKLEKTLYNATYLYINSNDYTNTDNYAIITTDTLIYNGYLNDFTDKDDNKCNGYSSVTLNKDNNYNIIPYIECEDYKTTGY